MAFHRLFRARFGGERFTVRGDGKATRDFTYVDDVVDAVVAAGTAGWDGVVNIGGGHRVALTEVLDLVQSLVGPIDIGFGPVVPGDARDTSADTTLAREVLGWAPKVELRDGLAAMAAWAAEAFRAEPVHQ